MNINHKRKSWKLVTRTINADIVVLENVFFTVGNSNLWAIWVNS